DRSTSLGYATDAERARDDKAVFDKENAVVGPSPDNNTLTKAHHSNNDIFENVFALEILNHEQLEVEKSTKIKLLNKEILNLKSQACQKEKSFHKENEKYAEYVQPLLNRKNELEKTNQEFLKQINDLNNKLLKAGHTAQTFHMLLPKDDNVNTGKKGLGFENQNDAENPFVLNKDKGLTRSLYNIDEMGKDLLFDHKIISEEELKCKAKKRLKVKQRKYPLSYHCFLYGDTQFVEPPKVPLKRREVNLKKHLEQAQMIQEKVFAHAALQNELRKSKGNSVDAKFAKPSILGKLPLQPLRNQSVVRQPNAFKSEQPRCSNPQFASQFDVKNDLSKLVTLHYWPNMFLLSHKKCVARYTLFVDSRLKKALFTSPVAAKFRNLRATFVVAKSRFSVAKTPTATNKISSVSSLSPDSSQRTVCFGNDHFAAITGYGDYVQGNLMICHVYYVEGLEHNLFSVRQFCDGDLEVAFRSNTCYVRNLEGEDLLTDSRNSNLYIISIFELAASSPVCLMSKATSTKSWLWHQRLSHLNFEYYATRTPEVSNDSTANTLPNEDTPSSSSIVIEEDEAQ
nr:integrase, catalytic region, zinc finger, CCHC-type, peptidase aspartic, catalytic [Tanacetum cinerariifolium]